MIKQKDSLNQASKQPINIEDKIDVFNESEFFDFCMKHKDLRIERTKEGEVIFMLPMGAAGGNLEALILYYVQNWNMNSKAGKVFSPSTGFITHDRWNSLTEEQQNKFAPICPDFIIELRSQSDNVNTLKEKMNEWIENGVQLAWLIDPIDEKAYIYRPNKEVREIKSFDESLSGENILIDFTLDLKSLK